MKSSSRSARGAAGTLAVALATAACASSAAAATVRGTVVHHNSRAHSFVIANPKGQLTAVHAAASPRIGTTVVARVHRLRNGTYALLRLRRTGRRTHVRAHGIVTFVDARNQSFVLSAEGVSMTVYRTSRRPRAASLPALGTRLTVSADLGSSGSLEAQSVSAEGAQNKPFDLEGVVMAIDLSTATLTISAEDNAQSGQILSVTVPAGINLSLFAPGQEVELQVVLRSGSLYELTGSSSDEGVRGAEDAADQQGETTNAGDREEEASGDHSSSDQHEGSAGGDSAGSGTNSDEGGSPSSGSTGSTGSAAAEASGEATRGSDS